MHHNLRKEDLSLQGETTNRFILSEESNQWGLGLPCEFDQLHQIKTIAAKSREEISSLDVTDTMNMLESRGRHNGVPSRILSTSAGQPK